MSAPTAPLRQDLVLIGGGHAHVQVLKAFAMRPEPGLRLTLITDRLMAPYSGMLPGCIAGDYTEREIHIDLLTLARLAGARLIHAAATGVAQQTRQVLFAERPPLGFDLLSINVGITPDLSSLAGAEDLAIPVKPIAGFLQRMDDAIARLERLNRPSQIAVIGGGAAGIELAIALQDRLINRQRSAEFTLIAGGGLAAGLNAGVRKRVLKELQSRGIRVIERDRAVQLDPGRLTLASGRTLPIDAPFVSTDARPPAWLAALDLPKAENGGLAVNSDLRVPGRSDIFAAGDCASMVGAPRPRAGVFAVRQGAILAENLRRAHRGETLRTMTPQSDFLTLLRIGRNRAIGGRGRFVAAQAGWLWTLKDRIDRSFMEKFAVEPLLAEDTREMRCAGCAAKVGPSPLRQALDQLAAADTASHAIAHDDAAIVDWFGKALALTVDQIRALVDDPWLFGRIAAHHALNDIYAMGGEPRQALALASLPVAAPRMVAGDLFQMLAGAQRTLDEAGCALIGGHSAEGQGLSLGFAITGAVADKIAAAAGQAGDVLLLTKPLGTGVIMAAEMRRAASPRAYQAAVENMLRSNAAASRLAREHGCHAMTDVSGFGLAGHLLTMLGPDLGATIEWSAVPMLPKVVDLVMGGYRSSLADENAQLSDRIDGLETLPAAPGSLLFDPQTAGGLLIAVPAERADSLAIALRKNGYPDASAIGRLVRGKGRISLN